MTDRAEAIVQEARALLTEIHGAPLSCDVLARFLAMQIIQSSRLISVGYARAGSPSKRPPKAQPIPIDGEGRV